MRTCGASQTCRRRADALRPLRPACVARRSGAVISPLTGTNTVGAGGGMTRQNSTQVASLYARTKAYGVTVMRVYDAVGSGAATLATAGQYGMMGARAPRATGGPHAPPTFVVCRGCY